MTKEELKQDVDITFADNGSEDISAKDSRDTFNNVIDSMLANEDVVDNINTTNQNKPLSANQGKILADMIRNTENVLSFPLYTSEFETSTSDWSGLVSTSEGATISNSIVSSSKEFGLGEMAYEMIIKGNLNITFKSSGESTSSIKIDLSTKKISIVTPQKTIENDFTFYNYNNWYRIRLTRNYQTITLSVIDMSTYEEVVVSATRDGGGGYPRINPTFVPLFYGKLSMEFSGEISNTIIENINILTRKADLLIYGDSVTSQEEYMPTADFINAWGMNIAKMTNGVTSSIGGSTIVEVKRFLVNEVPYIKPKFVMVTIGTNGGNTVENLTDLVDAIEANGAVCILNNIPCTSRNLHIEANSVIEQVRTSLSINGALLDIPTSVNKDGVTTNTNLFYKQDYTESSTPSWGVVYHHPNAKGSRLLINRVLNDVPEIF